MCQNVSEPSYAAASGLSGRPPPGLPCTPFGVPSGYQANAVNAALETARHSPSPAFLTYLLRVPSDQHPPASMVNGSGSFAERP